MRRQSAADLYTPPKVPNPVCASQGARVLFASDACNRDALGPISRLFSPSFVPQSLEKSLSIVPSDIFGSCPDGKEGALFNHSEMLLEACKTALECMNDKIASSPAWSSCSDEDRLALAILLFDYGGSQRAIRNPLGVVNRVLCERNAMPQWLCRDLLYRVVNALSHHTPAPNEEVPDCLYSVAFLESSYIPNGTVLIWHGFTPLLCDEASAMAVQPPPQSKNLKRVVYKFVKGSSPLRLHDLSPLYEPGASREFVAEPELITVVRQSNVNDSRALIILDTVEHNPVFADLKPPEPVKAEEQDIPPQIHEPPKAMVEIPAGAAAPAAAIKVPTSPATPKAPIQTSPLKEGSAISSASGDPSTPHSQSVSDLDSVEDEPIAEVKPAQLEEKPTTELKEEPKAEEEPGKPEEPKEEAPISPAKSGKKGAYPMLVRTPSGPVKGAVSVIDKNKKSMTPPTSRRTQHSSQLQGRAVPIEDIESETTRGRSSSEVLPSKDVDAAQDDDPNKPVLTQAALTAGLFEQDDFSETKFHGGSRGGSSSSSMDKKSDAPPPPSMDVPVTPRSHHSVHRSSHHHSGSRHANKLKRHESKRHRKTDHMTPSSSQDDVALSKEAEIEINDLDVEDLSPSMIAAEGDSLAEVLKILSDPQLDEDATVDAISRVKEFLDDEDIRVMAVRDGIIPAVVGVYRMHADNADVAQIVARILASCAFMSPESKIIVAQQGGVEMLLDAMIRFVDIPECVVSCLVALTNISSQDENHLNTALMEKIPFIMSLLEKYLDLIDVCELACFVLRNLSASKHNTGPIVQNVELLIPVLLKYIESDHITGGICVILLNIAIIKEECPALCQRPVIAGLFQIIEHYADQIEICQDAVAAIAYISALDASRDSLIEEGAVPLLATLLHVYVGNNEVICQRVCWALRNLSNYKEVCSALWAHESAVSDLCAALSAHTNTLAVTIFCCWSLCNLFAEHQCPPDLLRLVVPAMIAALAVPSANNSLKKAVLFSFCHLSARMTDPTVLLERNVLDIVISISKELGDDANVCSAAATTIKQFAAAGCMTAKLLPTVMPGLLNIFRSYDTNVIICKEVCQALWHILRSPDQRSTPVPPPPPTTSSEDDSVDVAKSSSSVSPETPTSPAGATTTTTTTTTTTPTTPTKSPSKASTTTTTTTTTTPTTPTKSPSKASSSSEPSPAVGSSAPLPLGPYIDDTFKLVLAGLNNHFQDVRYAEPAVGCLAELTRQSSVVCQMLVNMNGIPLLLNVLKLHTDTVLVPSVLQVLCALLSMKDNNNACKVLIEQNGLQDIYNLCCDLDAERTVVVGALCVVDFVSSSSKWEKKINSIDGVPEMMYTLLDRNFDYQPICDHACHVLHNLSHNHKLKSAIKKHLEEDPKLRVFKKQVFPPAFSRSFRSSQRK